MPRRLVLFVAALGTATTVGCDRDPACASAPETCTLPDACAELRFPTCAEPGATAHFIETAEPLVGPSALGAVGDVLLENGQVRLVIDALRNPNHIAPTGGSILDFETRGGDNDTLNHIWSGTGPLPADAIAYTALRVENKGDTAQVIVTGHLVGDERNKAATVYTLKSCEPGVHVTTEIKNGSDEDNVWAVQDGYWWGTKGDLPFIPNSTRGHTHPSFGLSNINAVFTASPFLVGSSHHAVGASYVSIGCNIPAQEGFHSTQVSAFGAPRSIVAPGDYITFSRFIAPAPGPGVQPAADIGYDVREQLFDESRGEVRGRLTGLDEDSPRGPTEVVLFAGPRPATIVEPGPDGRFVAQLPQTEAGLYEVRRFGRVVRRGSFTLQGDDDDARTDLGNIPVAAAAQLSLTVSVGGVPAAAQVFITPADAATRRQTEARFQDNGPLCAPMLGYAYGASPACHRILVDGNATVAVPAGRYRLNATKGMLYSLAQVEIDVAPGDVVEAAFSIRRIIDTGPGGPLGAVLGGDFHVMASAATTHPFPTRRAR